MRVLTHISLLPCLLPGIAWSTPINNINDLVAKSDVSRDLGELTVTKKRDLTSQLITQSILSNNVQSAQIYSATPYLREGVIEFKLKVDGIAEGLAINASTSIDLGTLNSKADSRCQLVPVGALPTLLQNTQSTATQKAEVIGVNFQGSNVVYHVIPEGGQLEVLTGDTLVHELNLNDASSPAQLAILASTPKVSRRQVEEHIPIHCDIVCPIGLIKIQDPSTATCSCGPMLPPPRRSLSDSKVKSRSLKDLEDRKSLNHLKRDEERACTAQCGPGWKCVRHTFQGEKDWCAPIRKGNEKRCTAINCRVGWQCVKSSFEGEEKGWCEPIQKVKRAGISAVD
ncbi:MAG: hypothetical protein Q9227_001716 [Pyrenula ochraceoflavens]